MAEIQGALRFFVIACAFISFVLAAARWRIASWASVAAPLYIQDCLLVIFLILATNRSVITPRKRTMIIASVLVAAKILSDILIPFIAEGKLQGSSHSCWKKRTNFSPVPTDEFNMNTSQFEFYLWKRNNDFQSRSQPYSMYNTMQPLHIRSYTHAS
eukprot:gene11301-3339_t